MNGAQPGLGGTPGQGSSGDDWSTPTTRFDTTAAADAFSSGTTIELVTPNRAPVLWIALGLVLGIAAVVIALVGRTATTGLIGWILAGPLAIGTVAMFSVSDAKRRESGWYAPSSLAEWGRRALILLALVAVTLCAWFIANDVARGVWR